MSHINRFEVAIKRIELTKGYEPPAEHGSQRAPYGHFQGRHIIGEQTPINHGVFISALPCEALVVDDEYSALSFTYDQLLTEFARDHGTSHHLEHNIMPYVARLVEKTMTYSPRSTEKFLEGKSVAKDAKTSLTVLIESGIGAARHLVLLQAYLLERLILAGYLRGSFFLHSKPERQLEEDEGITYTAPDGTPYVFTPGLSYDDS